MNEPKKRYVGAFWTKVLKAGPDECWPWLGYKKKSGHGLTQLKGTPIHTHRKAWILTHGPIAEGMCVNHTCHNQICCNPAHMYLGSRAQNMADRFGIENAVAPQIRHDRVGRPTAMSPAQKFELKQMRAAGITLRRCAAMLNVSYSTVRRVLHPRGKAPTSEVNTQAECL